MIYGIAYLTFGMRAYWCVTAESEQDARLVFATKFPGHEILTVTKRTDGKMPNADIQPE